MLRKIKTPLALSAALALSLALAGCDGPPKAPLDQAPLAGAAIGGPFTLTDQNGKQRQWSDFRGKFTTVYFGYTFCPDVCPIDTQRTAQGIALFRKEHPDLADRVQQVFITVDPTRDTPEKVGQFAAAFGKDIVGLTGSPAEIEKVTKEFKVFYEKGKDEGDGAYLVNHSNVTYLFGPEGQPVATLPTDLGAEDIAKELARWVR
ncbi:SCO family protein [Tsuneonella suprasediminis]|uniref:SCO family protein n=1 Tax=Tsuneonella suprasediminis TaxID=2306996 RepID=UPI002F942860